MADLVVIGKGISLSLEERQDQKEDTTNCNDSSDADVSDDMEDQEPLYSNPEKPISVGVCAMNSKVRRLSYSKVRRLSYSKVRRLS